MTYETDITFAADHASLAGHFPGQPVVAGVLILDQVRLALQQWQPTAKIVAVSQVKFASPLLPEQTLRISLELQQQKCRFHCDHQHRRIAQGEFTLAHT